MHHLPFTTHYSVMHCKLVRLLFSVNAPTRVFGEKIFFLFFHRRFIGINPERGTKATTGTVVSKKTGKLVQKKPVSVNPQVATLLKKLLDFEWEFIGRSTHTHSYYTLAAL